jgi:4-hydroxybenzoate polyprenyltransferase
MSENTDTSVSDAASGNWVDSLAPRATRPFLRLGRFDRPIGAWLLLWPGWWSLALAASEAPLGWEWAVTGLGANGEGLPDPILMVAFLIAAFSMRAAGCTFNDIIDRNIDAQVARTASRPLPSGQVTVAGAITFLIFLSGVGLAILLTMNRLAILMGVASLALVAFYPFAKRITNWPQLFLGLAFSWGALLGWTAFTGSISAAPLGLYAGSILWVIGYDTIYAHQDVKDDARIGIKSTALLLGATSKPWLAGFYALGLGGIALAAWLADVWMPAFGAVMIAGAAQLAWQVIDLDLNDPANCLAKFRSNHVFGMIVLAAIVIGQVMGPSKIPIPGIDI